MALLWVGLGGFLGAAARFQVGQWISPSAQAVNAFPLATLVVNALGSFIIGFLAFLNVSGAGLAGNLKLFLITGLLGGFTTFSAFSLETLRLLESGAALKALANVMFNLMLCLVFVWAGAILARLVSS